MADTFQTRIRNAPSWAIPCPKCGEQTKKSLAWLMDNVEFVCTCGGRVDLRSVEWQARINEIANIVASSTPTVTPLD